MSIEKFKDMLREAFKQELEGIDRVTRHRRGYGDEESSDDYHDVWENVESEDRDRLRRAADGYGETPFEEDIAIVSSDEDIQGVLNALENDRDTPPMPPLQNFLEKAPEGKEAEDFVMKNKMKFKKQYGEKGKDVLDATAGKLFKKDK